MNRTLEAAIAGGNDFQFHGAVLHQGNFGRHDLDVKRHRLGNGHGHAVANVAPDLAIVIAADEHRLLHQPALDLAITLLVPSQQFDQSGLRLRVRGRGQNDRRRVLVSGNGEYLCGLTFSGSPCISRFTSPPKSSRCPLTIKAIRFPWAPGDHVDIARSLGQADRQSRFDRRNFQAVDKLRAPATHLVGDIDDVPIVLRRGEADVAVRPVAVVIAGNVLAFDAGDVQRAVQRCAELPGEHADIKDLALLRRKNPAVAVAWRVDDAVQGRRSGERRGVLGVLLGSFSNTFSRAERRKGFGDGAMP